MSEPDSSPDPFLQLLDSLSDRITERQARAFCVECCRRIWDSMPDEGRRAVEVGEQCLRGGVDEDELATVNELVGGLCDRLDGCSSDQHFALFAAFHATWQDMRIEEVEDCARNAEMAGLDIDELCRLFRETVEPTKSDSD